MRNESLPCLLKFVFHTVLPSEAVKTLWWCGCEGLLTLLVARYVRVCGCHWVCACSLVRALFGHSGICISIKSEVRRLSLNDFVYSLYGVYCRARFSEMYGRAPRDQVLQDVRGRRLQKHWKVDIWLCHDEGVFKMTAKWLMVYAAISWR